MRYYRLTAICLVAAIILLETLTVSASPKTNQDLIRLHVIANSNDIVDQGIKLKVRNRILTDLRHNLPPVDNTEEVKKWLQNNLESIESSVEEELELDNRKLTVRAEYGEFPFPQKKYPFGVLRAGTYKSLRVFLGEGKGRNWWCVLYPPLCLLSTDTASIREPKNPDSVKIEFRLAAWEKWRSSNKKR